jgi:hypothetical protein
LDDRIPVETFHVTLLGEARNTIQEQFAPRLPESKKRSGLR